MRAYRVAYDGRAYHGFQRQPSVPTVEDTLFDALRELDVLEAESGGEGGVDTDRPAGYAAAGRTDAGVSALAQTVAFEAPDWLTPAALNGELPADVRAWASAEVSPDFHATHDAAAREYVYHLYAPGTGVDGGSRPGGSFSDERARRAFAALTGEHDFHNLTPDDEGTVRELRGSLRRDGDVLVVRLRAGGFARQLVRRVVSLVAEVGRGERDPDAVGRVLATEPLPGHEGVAPAPPYPLVLAAVEYPGVSFAVDTAAVASCRSVFAERRAEHVARARVAGTILDGLEER